MNVVARAARRPVPCRLAGLPYGDLAVRRWGAEAPGGPALDLQQSRLYRRTGARPGDGHCLRRLHVRAAHPGHAGRQRCPGRQRRQPAPAGSSPVPGAEPQPVPGNVARSVARRVLEAVGVNPDAARVDTAGGQRSVVFSPEVAGLTVLGAETRVSVDERGQIVDAFGWLATPTEGATYPLISARQAYDQLRQQPQPLMGLSMAPCRIVPGTSGCAPTPDRVVTGATLGLTQAYSTDRGILLVPAWLFQVRGESTPRAVVAVEAAFLGAPEQPSLGGQATTGSEPGSVGGGSGANGSTENTGAPTRVVPSGPATAPATQPAR